MISKHLEELVYDSGKVQVDDIGRIWRLRSGKYIRAESPMAGYLGVRLMIRSIRYQAQAHRIVYRHHFGCIPGELTINHKDGNKLNNHPNNLELATYSEQRLHAIHVLGVSPNITSILHASDVLDIRRLYGQGVKQAQLASMFDVNFRTIHAIVRGLTWKSLAMEVVK